MATLDIKKILPYVDIRRIVKIGTVGYGTIDGGIFGQTYDSSLDGGQYEQPYDNGADAGGF